MKVINPVSLEQTVSEGWSEIKVPEITGVESTVIVTVLLSSLQDIPFSVLITFLLNMVVTFNVLGS